MARSRSQGTIAIILGGTTGLLAVGTLLAMLFWPAPETAPPTMVITAVAPPTQPQTGTATGESPTTEVIVAQPATAAPTNTASATVPPVSPTPIAASVLPDADGLRLRAEPRTGSEILTMLAGGTPLLVLGRSEDGGWLNVRLTDGSEGWVAAAFVALPEDMPAPVPASAMPAPVTVVATSVEAAPTDPPAPQTALIPVGDYADLYNVQGAAAAIYITGQALGRRSLVFSKVGDSITAGPNSSFLSYCTPQSELGAFPQLTNVIGAYWQAQAREGRLSFNNNSLAAGNGWGASEILDPEEVESDQCLPDESPLACEYRLVNPAVALIMVGTNDSGGIAADVYRARLNQIVAYSIEEGIIPVLFTIPPKRFEPATDGRVDEFNAIVREIAVAWRTPLVDYHAAMLQAPNLGLSPDGVHPSEPPDGHPCRLNAENLNYGTPIRNLMALQMLDVLWRRIIAPGL